MTRSDIIDIEGTVHHRTDMAVLFSTSGERDDAEWLPNSQIELDDSSAIVVVTLPEQLALDKGLI